VIIHSLVRYYDILSADTNVKIARPGYSPANVSFILVISDTGELTNIVDIRADGKKKRSRVLYVPYQESRTSGISPYFLCDKAQYIFGLEHQETYGKKQNSIIKDVTQVLEETGMGRIVITRRSLESMKKFREFHHFLLDSVNDPAVEAFLKYLDTWKPDMAYHHPKIAEFKDDLFAGALFVFEYHGECLHKNVNVKSVWEHHLAMGGSEGTTEMQCLVSGKIEPVSRLHKWIKGVKGTQAQGAPLISFNNESFCSYRRDQSYNSPISARAMFKYTTVLNHLLEWESKNRIQIGDTTVVFWAETEKTAYENLVLALLDPDNEVDEIIDESETVPREKDLRTRQLVNDILQKVKTGHFFEEKDLGIDPETTNFYILGLSPNQGRLVVRFWHQDTFGNFITRLARHHIEMEIEQNDSVRRNVSMKWLLKMTVPRNSDDKTISPLLGGLLMKSILNDTPYPIPMYNAILNRVKVERSINYPRAGFIKACLIRRARARGNHEEDMITVSLNKESTDIPYRLGRLFAVLEKTQSDSNKDLKSTINSKYFSSASTTPAVVFPVLLKLAQHHITKSEWGFKSNQWIEEIVSDIDEFPAYLNLEDQGKFMLGYYHQRNAFFKKREESEQKEEPEL